VIVTSTRLSRRMARLKADEAAMRSTIGELLAATDSAERAIAALRATVAESDRTLSERLGAAAHHSSRLAEQVSAGESVISRVVQIAAMSSRLRAEEAPHVPAPVPVPAAPVPAAVAPEPRDGLRATMEAARQLAARAARRLEERAA
jgi:hypothetical protein